MRVTSRVRLPAAAGGAAGAGRRGEAMRGRCPTESSPALAGLGRTVSSRPNDHAPGLIADRYRFGHAQIWHVDLGNVVADAVGGVEPALVVIEGEVPDALPDQEILLHLISLGVDDGDVV